MGPTQVSQSTKLRAAYHVFRWMVVFQSKNSIEAKTKTTSFSLGKNWVGVMQVPGMYDQNPRELGSQDKLLSILSRLH